MTPPQPETRTEPLLNIRGVKVALGPIAREHLPLLARWTNDFSVTLYSGDGMRPRPLAAVEAVYKAGVKAARSEKVGFIIYDHETLVPVGDICLREIWPTRGTAELGVAIGEKAHWSKGYGSEAVVSRASSPCCRRCLFPA